MSDKRHYKVIFLLDAYLEKGEDGRWRFSPIDHSGTVTLAEWRFRAAAFLLKEKMVDKIVCVGGKKLNDMAHGEVLDVDVMAQALVDNYEVSADQVEALESPPRTLGNAKAIADYLLAHGLNPTDTAVMTNFFHLPRAANFLVDVGVSIRLFAAEAFFVDTNRKEILNDYGCAESPFANRLIGELSGMRDLEYGTYGKK